MKKILIFVILLFIGCYNDKNDTNNNNNKPTKNQKSFNKPAKNNPLKYYKPVNPRNPAYPPGYNPNRRK